VTGASYHIDGGDQPLIALRTALGKVLEAAEHVEMPLGESGKSGTPADGNSSRAV
jgi:hypothetical protein